jgi:hypothetical protein
MSQLEIRPLTREHEARMHAINRACPVEADFTFFFDREPEFFRWPESVFESFVYVGGFRDRELVAYALFATARGHAGALSEHFVFVGDARVLPGERGQGFPEKAARCALELVQPGGAGFLLLKRGNVAARAAMAKIRLESLAPAYMCGFDAANILLLRRTVGARRFEVRRANDGDVLRLAELMQRAYAGRLFAPIVSPEELRRDLARLPGLGIESYRLAFAGNELVGAVGAWDGDSMRRATVVRFSPRGWVTRAAYQTARVIFRSAAPMPSPGQSFRSITTTRVAVPSDDPDILRDLILTIHNEHLGRGYHTIVVGFTGEDPLASALRGLPVQHFLSDVAVFAPPSNVATIQRERRPYVDLRFV